jgi:hypothetical protein
MNSGYLKITIALAVVMTLMAGCATERYIVPTLSEPPRAGLWGLEGCPLNHEIVDETYERKIKPNQRMQPIGQTAGSR